MAVSEDALEVTKLLTYVFEDDAPLPEVERLDLTDGLYLAQISPFLLQADDNYHLLAVTPRFSEFFRDFLHRSTLNIAYRGRKELDYEGVASEEESARRKTDYYLLSATIVSPNFLAPFAAFVIIPDEHRVCHSWRMKDISRLELPDCRPLTDADFAGISQLYGPIKAMLSAGTTGRLPTALRYYQQAFRSDIDWSMRFLGLMMAMEALFSHGASEISHQVSERTAFLLQQSPGKREGLYKQMRSHYSLRSRIAHGGTPNGEREELGDSFGQLLLILRNALARILGDSALLPLFRSASGEEFNNAMRSLVFLGTATPQN
jgi:hypothetical protein